MDQTILFLLLFITSFTTNLIIESHISAMIHFWHISILMFDIKLFCLLMQRIASH